MTTNVIQNKTQYNTILLTNSVCSIIFIPLSRCDAIQSMVVSYVGIKIYLQKVHDFVSIFFRRNHDEFSKIEDLENSSGFLRKIHKKFMNLLQNIGDLFVYLHNLEMTTLPLVRYA